MRLFSQNLIPDALKESGPTLWCQSITGVDLTIHQVHQNTLVAKLCRHNDHHGAIKIIKSKIKYANTL